MPSRILNIQQLVSEWAIGKNFYVLGNANKHIEVLPAHMSLEELDSMIEHQKLFSIEDRKPSLNEWLMLLERHGKIVAPEDGYCWNCHSDLVRHYLRTDHLSQDQCPFCHLRFDE